MSNNTDLFKSHLESLKLFTTRPEEWLAHFTEDAVIEFPYAHSIGSEGRLNGKNEVRRYIKALSESGLNFETIQFSDIKVYTHSNAESFTAEMKGWIPSKNGKPEYRQAYICLIETKMGKISFYKEYWNPFSVMSYMGK